MAIYVSRYTGTQIDEGIDKANRVPTIEKQLQTNEKNIAANTQDIDALKIAMESLEGAVASHTQTLSDHTTRITAHEREIYNINQKLVTEDEVTAIVQEQLGVIENGTY